MGQYEQRQRARFTDCSGLPAFVQWLHPRRRLSEANTQTPEGRL